MARQKLVEKWEGAEEIQLSTVLELKLSDATVYRCGRLLITSVRLHDVGLVGAKEPLPALSEPASDTEASSVVSELLSLGLPSSFGKKGGGSYRGGKRTESAPLSSSRFTQKGSRQPRPRNTDDVGGADDTPKCSETPWVQGFDEQWGCHYYYNAQTQESVWEAPAEGYVPWEESSAAVAVADADAAAASDGPVDAGTAGVGISAPAPGADASHRQPPRMLTEEDLLRSMGLWQDETETMPNTDMGSSAAAAVDMASGKASSAFKPSNGSSAAGVAATSTSVAETGDVGGAEGGLLQNLLRNPSSQQSQRPQPQQRAVPPTALSEEQLLARLAASEPMPPPPPAPLLPPPSPPPPLLAAMPAKPPPARMLTEEDILRSMGLLQGSEESQGQQQTNVAGEEPQRSAAAEHTSNQSASGSMPAVPTARPTPPPGFGGPQALTAKGNTAGVAQQPNAAMNGQQGHGCGEPQPGAGQLRHHDHHRPGPGQQAADQAHRRPLPVGLADGPPGPHPPPFASTYYQPQAPSGGPARPGPPPGFQGHPHGRPAFPGYDHPAASPAHAAAAARPPPGFEHPMPPPPPLDMWPHGGPPPPNGSYGIPPPSMGGPMPMPPPPPGFGLGPPTGPPMPYGMPPPYPHEPPHPFPPYGPPPPPYMYGPCPMPGGPPPPMLPFAGAGMHPPPGLGAPHPYHAPMDGVAPPLPPHHHQHFHQGQPHHFAHHQHHQTAAAGHLRREPQPVSEGAAGTPATSAAPAAPVSTNGSGGAKAGTDINRKAVTWTLEELERQLENMAVTATDGGEKATALGSTGAGAVVAVKEALAEDSVVSKGRKQPQRKGQALIKQRQSRQGGEKAVQELEDGGDDDSSFYDAFAGGGRVAKERALQPPVPGPKPAVGEDDGTRRVTLDPNTAAYVRTLLPRSAAKYWMQRYSLFSRFDSVVQLDTEGWWSVTPEVLAAHQAVRSRDLSDQGLVAIDACCGCGGNVIQMASVFPIVFGVEISERRVEMARHNAGVYEVSHKCQFLCADFFQVAPDLKVDVLFMSPPWGGPKYQHVNTFDVFYPLPGFNKSLYRLLDTTMDCVRGQDGVVAAFLPRNTDLAQLASVVPEHAIWEVERAYVNNKLKGITLYCHPGRTADEPNVRLEAEAEYVQGQGQELELPGGAEVLGSQGVGTNGAEIEA